MSRFLFQMIFFLIFFFIHLKYLALVEYYLPTTYWIIMSLALRTANQCREVLLWCEKEPSWVWRSVRGMFPLSRRFKTCSGWNIWLLSESNFRLLDFCKLVKWNYKYFPQRRILSSFCFVYCVIINSKVQRACCSMNYSFL